MTDQGARTAPSRASTSGLGATVTLDVLAGRPYDVLARLRADEPVAWLPVLGGWLVTRRDLCIEVMRDADRFTVDDPRFSTAQVVGPSMLSLDGTEHRRHRDPFATAFHKPEVAARFTARVQDAARSLVASLGPRGSAEIRRDLAGPLAVEVVATALDLVDTEPAAVLGWYDEIVAAVDRVSVGGEIGPRAEAAVRTLERHVSSTIGHGSGVLAEATETLRPAEIASNAAVMMFGGIETGEGMTTNLFWHLLTDPGQLTALRADRTLGPNAVDESLRLEPAAARVDRYATAGQPRSGGLSRPGHVRHRAARRPDAPRLCPGSPRLRRPAPRAARDARRAGCRAGRLARPPTRRRGNGTHRAHLSQASVAAGPLGSTAGAGRGATYQTSPGRHSQLIRAARSTPTEAGVNRTMM
jgi:cytochrome P450